MSQATKKKPRTTKTKSCKCADLVDKQLAERNVKLTREFMLSMSDSSIKLSPPALSTQKLDAKKRTKPPTVYCTYCPFCGKKVAD